LSRLRPIRNTRCSSKDVVSPFAERNSSRYM
jgi:hypothetical protein